LKVLEITLYSFLDNRNNGVLQTDNALVNIIRKLAHFLHVKLNFDAYCLLGVFIARGKEDALVTYNLVIGESVYGEKRISVEVLETELNSSVNLL